MRKMNARKIGHRLAGLVLSALLPASMVIAPGSTVTVFADGESPEEIGYTDGLDSNPALEELAANMQSGNAVYDFLYREDSEGILFAPEDMAGISSYDLRDWNYVTPVRFQNPYGTCWGFAAIAASETSLLSSGLAAEDGYDAGTLDLSEKHLAYFATQPVDNPDHSEYGEGYQYKDGMSLQQKLNAGGVFLMATSLFSSGIGPNLEDRNYPQSSGMSGTMEDVLGYHGWYRSIEKKQTQVLKDGEGTGVWQWVDSNYSADDDWEIDHNYRFYQSYQLRESNCLPCPAETDDNGEYYYNPEGTRAIKSELLEGRGVSIGFRADSSMPNQEGGTKYISGNWAHYTYEQASASHGVTIVGWDDNYSRENFNEGHQPEYDGAWLVKNSWGSDEEVFPNNGYVHWGTVKTDENGDPVLDENGNEIHTGYFWLSYYDKSLDTPESFEFDRSNVDKVYYLSQYDLMPIDEMHGSESSYEVKMANVFHCDTQAVQLEQISCQTTRPGTTATYNIYLLPKDFTAPNDGMLAATLTRTYDYGGFHKESLDVPVKLQPNQTFSIEVILTVDDLYSMSLQCSNSKRYAEESGFPIWSNAVINEKTSFLSLNGSYKDLSDETLQRKLLGNEYDNLVMDNFSIKAYLTDAEEGQPLNDLELKINNNKNLTLNEEKNKNTLSVRLYGKSDVPAGEKVVWDCLEPEILEIAPDGNQDTLCRVTAKKAGAAHVTASMAGVGTSVCRIYISPPANEIISLETGSAGSRTLTVNFTDQREMGVSGYDVSYAPNGTGDRIVEFVGNDTNSIVLEDLEKGVQYQVSVRSVVELPDVTLKGEWGKAVLSDPIDPSVPVTGVKLDMTSATLAVGKNLQLNATVSPEDASEKTVTWKSSDTGVAKVDKNGKVTAKGAGTAKIVVTTKDGKKTASCKVKVVPKTPSPVTLANVKKGIKVSWKKDSSVSGYQIQYSTSSGFKAGNKKVTVKSAETTQKTLTGLQSKTRYYVRIRTYKTVDGKNYYSSWSSKKSIKTA